MDLDSKTEDLGPLRAEIEHIDHALVELIAERCRIARAVGRTKHRLGEPVLDSAREAVVIRRAAAHARELAVETETVREMFWLLIRLSRQVQLEEADGKR
ncbi:MAG: chorismate mutase [Gemmatimonadota bacterium]